MLGKAAEPSREVFVRFQNPDESIPNSKELPERLIGTRASAGSRLVAQRVFILRSRLGRSVFVLHDDSLEITAEPWQMAGRAAGSLFSEGKGSGHFAAGDSFEG